MTQDPNAMPDANPAPAGPPPGSMGYEAPPPGPMGYEAPPPGPVGYQAPPPMPKRGTNWVAIVVLIGIVAAIGGGFWLFRDRISGNVTDLAVGDCIDEPPEAETITEVQHQPCNAPHDGEVFAVLTNPAGPDEPYPVVSGFDDYIQTTCIPLWEAYTARTWTTDTELDLNYLHPTITGWGAGDRGFTCYLTRVDNQKLGASVKGIGASPLP